MKIIEGLNAESKNMVITINSPLLVSYYPSLYKMMTTDEKTPKGLTMEKQSPDTATISFPIDIGDIKMTGPNTGTAAISLEAKNSLDAVLSIANRFCNSAVKHILKTTEFCPILDVTGGYSYKKLQSDVESACKAKRDFLVIDSYKNYLEGTRSTKYEFNQYRIPYGTTEYVEFLLSVKEGKFKDLKKKYKNKLKKQVWF